MDILVYWIGKIIQTCAPGGSRTLDFLHARRAPYPLGVALRTGTPEKNNFPFVPNGKLIIFGCPKFWAHCSLLIMCLNTGTPKIHHFPFGSNGKVVVLRVPILMHCRVITGPTILLLSRLVSVAADPRDRNTVMEACTCLKVSVSHPPPTATNNCRNICKA